MVTKTLTEAILENPRLLDSNYISNPKLAKRFNLSLEDVLEMKKIAKKIVTDEYIQPEIKNLNESESGQSKIEITSDKRLSTEEIKKLVNVDDITTTISNVYFKSSSNGTKWDYTILVKHSVDRFYKTIELKEKLKEIFPEQTIIKTLPLSRERSIGKSLAIFISDDHVGMLLNESIFGNETPDQTYEERLLAIVQYIVDIPGIFNEIVVYSLGDQLNGFNQQTTRGGHIVPSTSNKEQFDVYTKARKVFYDALFTSGKSEKYMICEVNDSNHSGNGFSYMANELLKLYVETKYPTVEFDNSESFVNVTKIQGHVIITLHGKDSKEQKLPLPINLDPKTEVYFTDLILEYGINPKITPVHIFKGDLHRYNENTAKNFRYINVPAISNGSSWQEKNFGNSKAGVLIEIYTKGDPEPARKVLRF